MTVLHRDRDSCRPGWGGLGVPGVTACSPRDEASRRRSEPLPRLPLQGAVQHKAVPVLPGRARVRPRPLPHVRRRRPLGQQERVVQELQHPARLQEGASPAPPPTVPTRRCCEVGKAEGSPECHSGQRENGGLGGGLGPEAGFRGPLRWCETNQ